MNWVYSSFLSNQATATEQKHHHEYELWEHYLKNFLPQTYELSLAQNSKKKKMATADNGSNLLEVAFNETFHIAMTVTHSTAIVAQWIDETIERGRGHHICGPRQRHLVGLDITCQPNGNIALLQLCMGTRCLIYQLLRRDDACLPGKLHAFLNDNRFCFVTVALEEVVNALQMQHGLMVRIALDLGDEASKRLHRENLRWAGLDRLATEVLRLQINKPADVWRSAWWQEELSEEQISSACFDVFTVYELGRVLLC